MAQRVKLASALAAAATSDAQRIRTANEPFTVHTEGGYVGNVTIEHTTDDTNWNDIGTLASGDDLVIAFAPYKVRVNGTHTSGTADVYWLEQVN